MEFEDLDEVAQRIQSGATALANAITPQDALPGHDATGGHVRSLTEAVMVMTAGLVQIADAINRLADVVEARE